MSTEPRDQGSLREELKRRVPILRPVVQWGRRVARPAYRSLKALRTAIYRTGPLEARFRQIHRANLWEGDESRSGPGSSIHQTRAVRAELPRLIERHNVRSILDIPCGDFNWMKHVPLHIDYTGADIVDEIVARNTHEFQSSGRRFIHLNVIDSPLPAVDLVLCRDLLGHLSLRDMACALINISRSGSMFLLTTTFPSRHTIEDIRSGGWRPINLCAPPLSLPDPLEVIHEQLGDPAFADKSLGLWRVSDLPVDAMTRISQSRRAKRRPIGR